MPRKKVKSKVNKERLLDDINTAKQGEFCYFLDRSKKIWFGEIHKRSFILSDATKEYAISFHII